MQGEADRDDLRFRLDWEEEGLDVPASDTDFSFDWAEQRDDGPIIEFAAPEDGPFAAPEEDPFAGMPEPISVLDDDVDLAATGEVYEVPFYTDAEALESVRGVLNAHNDALVQLSDAVFELATNVGRLLEEIRSDGKSEGGGVAASAMVTLTASVEQLGDDLKTTRADLQGMMDDIVAASGGQRAGGKASEPRLFVELDRLHSELQALKRRLPVRSREMDVDEIVDRITDAVLVAIAEAAPAPPTTAAPARRRPVRAAPVEEEPVKPRPARVSAKRQRPLRAD